MKKFLTLCLGVFLLGCEDPVVTSKEYLGVIEDTTAIEVCSKWCHDFPAVVIYILDIDHSFEWRVPDTCSINTKLFSNYTVPVEKYLTEAGKIGYQISDKAERIMLFDICN